MKKDEGAGLVEVPDVILKQGKNIVQTKVPYQTAIVVQKPRSLDAIVNKVMKECEYAGQSFYYSWEIQGKRGKARVEGGSIGLAAALVREWGNCACPVVLEESEDSWVMTATFIDMETGANIQRIYRYRKDRVIPGRYEASRSEDMAFQAAQSRAIRNVVLMAMPRWLVEKAIDKAKECEIKKIDYEGIAAATDKAVRFLAGYGVTEQQIMDKVGKPKSEWVSDDIANLRGVAQALKDGQIRPEEVFSVKKGIEPGGPAEVSLKDITGTKKKESPAKPAPKEEPKPTGDFSSLLHKKVDKLRSKLKGIVKDDHCFLKVISIDFGTDDPKKLNESQQGDLILALEKEVVKWEKK